ncbi:MAG TPA: hypothetical protein VNZ49_16725, partial [Bacteroidia bacterium]|nr:hypothetical protein [Bacteroidia bacterium]
DATPFLNYAGNMFGKTSNNVAPTWNFLTNNQTISGRYFADEKTVYRGAVRLGFGSSKASNMVSDNSNTSTTPAYKEDTKTTGTSGIGLSGGIEMRKGKTRLQGYYGGEVGIYFGGKHDTYTYGNAFSASGASPWAPTSTTWSGLTPTGSSNMSSRTTAQKFGSTFTFGLRGFIGAEYFVLPKMSIGGEFGWGLGFTSVGQGSTTTEAVNSTFNGTNTTTVNTGKGSSFGLDTDNMNTVFGSSASLRFNMYF